MDKKETLWPRMAKQVIDLMILWEKLVEQRLWGERFYVRTKMRNQDLRKEVLTYSGEAIIVSGSAAKLPAYHLLVSPDTLYRLIIYLSFFGRL